MRRRTSGSAVQIGMCLVLIVFTSTPSLTERVGINWIGEWDPVMWECVMSASDPLTVYTITFH